jgi:hypothetical protein
MKHDLRDLSIVPRRPRGAEAISALIARYRRSGLSLAEFARAEGLSPGRLHYWIYQKHRSRAVVRAPGDGSPAARPAFQEVRLPNGLGLVTSWAAEVSLRGGLSVRFSAAAAPGWVGAVVQALQRPC